MSRERTIVAAGGVVWRPRPGTRNGVELLVAHRPRYDDWTFPKGKRDDGEPVQRTAVREIEEETGLRVHLGVPLPAVRYRVGAGPKIVHYWSAQTDPEAPGQFVPNKEVDEVRWLRPREARDLLTYAHDRDLLAAFRGRRDAGHHKARALVVLRHGKAASAGRWRGDDHDRPLTDVGLGQAEALALTLAQYGPARMLASPALRCQQTLAPLAAAVGHPVTLERRLVEDAPTAAVAAVVREAMARRGLSVLCSHLPTLTTAFDAIGLKPLDLAPGEGVVVHHRHGRVVSTERLP
ncbi:MAG: NUDIX hydrolase [Aeromicrobium sp.]|uniref:NUDIX hydrolase n=1 Tax=Aeromicrobium sp. TaxID=1871063 RepID=UPI0025BB3321|nr:NUDIX hydrolase [Aeromicrobium sp.]MCK5891424.1 NUDIX hydrolase [Aeromicrobium sp.]MDF1704430.1 NUDIX hydrolase [Aeromicrobium sp.]